MMKKVLSFVSITVLVTVLVLGFLNRQLLKDWFVVNSTDQQPEALVLKSNLDLTEQGDFLYKASRTQLQTAEEFNQSCQTVDKELSIVLGCYSQQTIYVFRVDDSRLDGVEEVTAAHELLHAVYERLPSNERTELDRELELAAGAINDKHFTDLLEQYKKSDASVLTNEIHSIIGTEVEVIPQNLEDHYAKYFNNRSKIVQYSKDYQAVFRENDEKIANYDSKLEQLKLKIEQVESQITQLESQLTQKQKELEQLRLQDTDSYNAQVPVFNSLVNRYNSLVEQARSLTSQYNQIVEDRNNIALSQTDLSQKLNSNYQTR